MTLEQEALEFIQSHEGAVPVDWVTKAIVDSHTLPECDERDWYLTCAYDAVRDAVRRAFRSIKASEEDPEPDRQFVLPGYDRLQRRYIITRKNEQIAVPIEDMSRDEILAKVAELTAKREGLSLHIDELLRYLENRQAS